MTVSISLFIVRETRALSPSAPQSFSLSLSLSIASYRILSVLFAVFVFWMFYRKHIKLFFHEKQSDGLF